MNRAHALHIKAPSAAAAAVLGRTRHRCFAHPDDSSSVPPAQTATSGRKSVHTKRGRERGDSRVGREHAWPSPPRALISAGRTQASRGSRRGHGGHGHLPAYVASPHVSNGRYSRYFEEQQALAQGGTRSPAGELRQGAHGEALRESARHTDGRRRRAARDAVRARTRHPQSSHAAAAAPRPRPLLTAAAASDEDGNILDWGTC